MRSYKLIVAPICLVASLIIACNMGQMPISAAQWWKSLLNLIQQQAQTSIDIVLWDIRLPRIFAAILVGAALSAAGATYQGMFKNPLVSPDILAVSSGASLGAVSAIYFDFPLLIIQLFAFIGGLISVGTVYLIASRVQQQNNILALVLSGIAISALLGACISLLKILADPYSQLSSITFWLLGGLNMVNAADLYFVAPLILLGLIPLILLRWRINLLSLEDDESSSLGINPKYYRLIFIVAATLITSATVSVTGIIGWVGLIVPHIARLWIGADFRYLLPTCLCLGASFLLLTDSIARALFVIEIPLGVITAFVGAPFFLALLLKGEKR